RVSLEDLVPWAAQQGFEALELAAWPYDAARDYHARHIQAEQFTGEDAERVRRLFDAHGLTISAMAYYDNNLHPDAEKRRTYHEHLRKVIDAAALLKVDLVGTFVGARPHKTPVEYIKE